MGSENSVQHFKYNPYKKKNENINIEGKQQQSKRTKGENILSIIKNKNDQNKIQKCDQRNKVNLKEDDNFSSILFTFGNEYKEIQQRKKKEKKIKTLKKICGQFMKPNFKEIVIISKDKIEKPKLKIHRIENKNPKQDKVHNQDKTKTDYPILLKSSLLPQEKANTRQNSMSNMKSYPKIQLKSIDYELDLHIQTKNPLLLKSETMKNTGVAESLSITKKIRSSKELGTITKKDRKKTFTQKMEFQCKNPIPKHMNFNYIPEPNTLFKWEGENGALKAKEYHKYYKQALTSKS